MDRGLLKEAINDLRVQFRVDKQTLSQVLEETLRDLLEERFGSADMFDVIVNPDTGTLEIWRRWRVVRDRRKVQDPERDLPLREARKIEPDAQEGDEVYERVDPGRIFGRREVMRAYERILRRLEELRTHRVYEKYRDLIGELVSGEVAQVLASGDVILLDEEGTEMLLPYHEQIGSERYRKGDYVQALVKEVRKKSRRGPMVILSRRDPRFLAKLLEREVSEIMDGLIQIVKVVRIPGKRAKVLVRSLDDRIDPVGAIVGVRGSRIRNVVRELGGETIDIVPYDPDPAHLIAYALEPARVNYVDIYEEKRYARVYMDPSQVPLAIGKEGLNIKLASRLTGYEIEVFRDQDVEPGDIRLELLRDELGETVIHAFLEAGLQTVHAVLSQSMEDLKTLVDLDPDVVEEAVQKMLKIVEERSSSEEQEV